MFHCTCFAGACSAETYFTWPDGVTPSHRIAGQLSRVNPLARLPNFAAKGPVRGRRSNGSFAAEAHLGANIKPPAENTVAGRIRIGLPRFVAQKRGIGPQNIVDTCTQAQAFR